MYKRQDLDDIGVIAHVGARCAEVDDARRLGRSLANGVNVRHNVVAHFLFARPGGLVVDVRNVCLPLVHLLLRYGQAERCLLYTSLCQLPVPGHISEEAVINAIDPKKDVDAFHPVNVGKIMVGNFDFVPCTPAGVMELIDEYQIDPKGKECVVVGRSNIVGKPMAMLLLHRHGTVTMCHSRTQHLDEVCRRADILVAAVGKAGFITPDMVKDGAVVIDVGINRNAEGKVCGDVDPAVMEKASYMTPVPGGAGPMTITMLMKNTLKAAKIQNGL